MILLDASEKGRIEFIDAAEMFFENVPERGVGDTLKRAETKFNGVRHCERSEAIQPELSRLGSGWIATLHFVPLAMTYPTNYC